jgi:diguanylate cyclase (GGDEF)-like protein/PAS domain S-box-containing protein
VREQLSDFLMKLSCAADAETATREGVRQARRALAAKAIALARDEDLIAGCGPGAAALSGPEGATLADGTHDRAELPGLGVAALAVRSVAPSGVRLLAARDAEHAFSEEELHLLGDMAAALALVSTVAAPDGDDHDGARVPAVGPAGAQRALRNSEHRLREILQGAPSPFVAIDADGLVLEWNLEAEATFGWPQGEAIGRRFGGLMIAPGERPAFQAEFESLVAASDGVAQHRRVELHALHREGHEVPVELWMSALRAGESSIVHIFIRDMSESVRAERAWREAEAQIAHLRLHDGLTGLPNRALLFDRLAHALAGAKRRGSTVAVLFIDLDDFRSVNERFGHEAGDGLLADLARRLREVIRRSDTMARVGQDTLARFGGDEFVIVCEDLEGEADAVAIAERVTSSLTDPLAVAGHQVSTTASIGIALAADEPSPDGLINEAETAMCRAKERGRDRYELFGQAMHADLRGRLQQESELRDAIEAGQLRLVYQPIVSVSDGGLVGAEALVRWQHPEHGLLAPAQFLPLAEETGAIVALGRWVLEEACAQAVRWRDQRDALFMRVAVNSSAHQLDDDEMMPMLTGVLARSGLEPSRLMLEITESALVREGPRAVELLTGVRALGVRISLDDFGTGYSSLSYLRRLPIDAVKLDRAFISGLDGTTVDRQIVAAIVQMARAMSMTVIAEGVETEAQWAYLRELGCHLAQGYHFGRPMPPAQMTSLLEEAGHGGGLRHPPAAAEAPILSS